MVFIANNGCIGDDDDDDDNDEEDEVSSFLGMTIPYCSRASFDGSCSGKHPTGPRSQVLRDDIMHVESRESYISQLGMTRWW